MNVVGLQDNFRRIGARVMVESRHDDAAAPGPAADLAVRADRGGPYFHFVLNPRRVAGLQVLHVRPARRHLMLLVQHRPSAPGHRPLRQRYLCGRQGRSWFVAPVPSPMS